jgi:acyl phosphate:glycerol-3-phosphate acyltransferase
MWYAHDEDRAPGCVSCGVTGGADIGTTGMGIMIMGILVAYLLGSISSAIVVSYLLGLPDPRGTGSGNPGATNVLRGGSKAGAALTLIGDVAKGWLPVFIVIQIGDYPGWLIGLSAWPPFSDISTRCISASRAARAWATALGVLLAISPLTGLLVAGTWLLVALTLRYSSLAALVAALAAPVYLAFLDPDPWLVATVCVMTLVLYARHYANIQRLLQGTEPRIGEKKAAA